MFAISFTSILIVLKQFFPYHPVQKKKAMVKNGWKVLGREFPPDTRKQADRHRIHIYSLCPQCIKEKLPRKRKTRLEHWCRGFCWKHATARGFKNDEASKACPQCAKEGLTGKVRSEAWCNGLCWVHAKARGFKNDKERRACPECAKEGLTGKARPEGWCEGLCKKHAGQKGMKDPKKKQKTKKTHMMKLTGHGVPSNGPTIHTHTAPQSLGGGGNSNAKRVRCFGTLAQSF